MDSESNKLFDDQLSYITGVSTDEETDTNSYNNQTYYKYIDNYIRNHNGNINLHNEHFKKTNLTLLFRIPQWMSFNNRYKSMLGQQYVFLGKGS